VRIGLLGLALAACARRPEGPNILLVTLDTTRRDHLGLYGYPLPTSPHLDRLAEASVVYTNAYAVSSWTLPTHASIFTGKLPTAHGATYDPAGPLRLSDGIDGDFGQYRARPIAEDETTLAIVLAEHGYATGGVIAGPWMKRRFRLAKGFEWYDDEGVTALNGRPAADVTRAALEFLDEHEDEPFFLFLNYYDPHGPWHDDPPLDEAGNPLRQPKPFQDCRAVVPPGMDPRRVSTLDFLRICYDAEIRAMDAEFGRLLRHLEESGRMEDTWIFVLADHGELLGDPLLGESDLWGHGDSLSQAEIHIPFLVKEPGPGGRTGRDPTPVLQTDILPTILARLGLPLPPGVQGKPLGTPHPILSELQKLPVMDFQGKAELKDWRHRGDWRVLVEGRDKFAWNSQGRHYLVDLERDPGEEVNLLSARRERAEELERELLECIARLPRPGATGAVEQPSAEDLEALRGLGYTGEDESPAPSTPTQAPEGG
jgi:arylsulfatase A-like enzyme